MGGPGPDKENKFQAGPELYCSAVARALDVITGPEAEVEAQLDYVDNVAGFGVGGRSSHGHYEMGDPKGEKLITIDGGILDNVSFEVTGEALVQAGVSLVVRGCLWSWGGHSGGGLLQSPSTPEK